MELLTGSPIGFEVLARWQHPVLGPILPSNFISLAEQHGVVDELMKQVFRKAFQNFSSSPIPVSLSVNISALQLRDLGLPNLIRTMAEAAGFPLSRLTVEITESALFDNIRDARTIAHDIKAMGCRLALDDFGTGYSSLRHLHSLPFDELKIDQSFISAMTTTRENRKIVAAIIGLAQSIELSTVAEGVETEVQAELLLLLGCARGQGWLYGRPVSGDGVPGLLAAKPQRAMFDLSNRYYVSTLSGLEALPSLRLAQLQAIYDGAPVGLCFLDREYRYLSLNERLAEMHGIPVNAHLGRKVSEMYPKLFSIFKPYLERALLGESIAGVEVREPPAVQEGTDTIWMASYQPARDEAGDVIGISVSVSVVTEMPRALERVPDVHDLSIKDRYPNQVLAEELFHSRKIFDAVSNGISICDAQQPDLPLIYVNPAFEQMTGYASGDVCGRNCRLLQNSDTNQQEARVLGTAIRQSRDARVLLRNYKKDGTLFWNELYLSPIFGRVGEVTHFLGIQNDVTLRVQAEERLIYLANYDPLTGLANRRLLLEKLGEALQRAGRRSGIVAVLFFDVDHLKTVNDTLGHEAGDALLRAVAKRLREGTRAEETVARLSGDEFVVVLESRPEAANPAEVMQRLVTSLKMTLTVSGHEFSPSASAGLAIYPRDGSTPEGLLKLADMNMYVAKHSRHFEVELGHEEYRQPVEDPR